MLTCTTIWRWRPRLITCGDLESDTSKCADANYIGAFIDSNKGGPVLLYKR